MKGVLVFLMLLGASLGHAASFDCARARLPVEKLICGNPDLSRADDELGFSYDYLETRCPSLFEGLDVRATQRKWVAGLRKIPGKGAPEASLAADAYRERNAFLLGLVSQCSPNYPRPESTVVRALELGMAQPKGARNYPDFSIPFVETDPPKVGRLINDQIFGGFFDVAAPKHLDDGLPGLLEEYRSRERSSPDEIRFSTMINNGRILVLNVYSAGCGSSCSSGESKEVFDLWNGRRVEAADLLTPAGAKTMAKRFRSAKLQRGWNIVRQEQLGVSPDCKRNGVHCEPSSSLDGDFLMHCAREDAERDWSRYWGMEPDADGRWRFWTIWSCRDSREGKSGRPFVQSYSLEELRPLLNDYGRSLLLGEGDVLEPGAQEFSCKQDSVAGNPPAGKAKVIDVRRFNDETLLLDSSGALWCWDASWRNKPPPIIIGAQVARMDAARFSGVVGVLKDGTLVSWVGGACSDGQKPVQLNLSLHQSRALADRDGELWSVGRDGTLGFWSVRTPVSPFTVATGVAEIGRGTRQELQMLKRDGSLWVWGGAREDVPAPDSEHWLRMGGGFSRLTGQNVDMAFRADGSLWAWGESLKAVDYAESGQERGPKNIGSGYISIHWAADMYAVGVKEDGSLWASYQRGRQTRMEPLGCGYKEAVAVGYAGDFPSPPDDVIVLALKQDGRLVGWGNWLHSSGWSRNEIFTQAPADLGKGFTQLFQVGSGYDAYAVAVKRDGSVWEFRTPRNPGVPKGLEVLRKIDFPAPGVSLR